MNSIAQQAPSAISLVLVLALAAGLVTALPADAAQAAQAAQAPMAAMFVPGSADLTPAGERWLDTQMTQKTARTAKMLIVKLPGAETSLQVRRAKVLREHLVVQGAGPHKLYFEAGGR